MPWRFTEIQVQDSLKYFYRHSGVGLSWKLLRFESRTQYSNCWIRENLSADSRTRGNFENDIWKIMQNSRSGRVKWAEFHRWLLKKFTVNGWVDWCTDVSRGVTKVSVVVLRVCPTSRSLPSEIFSKWNMCKFACLSWKSASLISS